MCGALKFSRGIVCAIPRSAGKSGIPRANSDQCRSPRIKRRRVSVPRRSSFLSVCATASDPREEFRPRVFVRANDRGHHAIRRQWRWKWVAALLRREKNETEKKDKTNTQRASRLARKTHPLRPRNVACRQAYLAAHAARELCRCLWDPDS